MSVDSISHTRSDEVDEEAWAARGLAIAVAISCLFWTTVITYFLS